VERLDDFYSECLGYPLKNVQSGEFRIVSSDRRLHYEEGYGIIFPFLLLCSNDRYLISVRPDMSELMSAFVQDISDAKAIFTENGIKVIGSLYQSILSEDIPSGLRWSQSLTHYIDKEHFKPFTVTECRQLTYADQELIDEMSKISEFICPDECIQNGTAFGVVVDGKLVSRSTTIITPNSTEKYNLVWIGVETLPEYRHNGYAKAVVSGITEIVLSRGQTPVYDHAIWNIASEKTAKSLGYQLYCETLRLQHP
jgi:predicted GNAT family acetyltransferase